MTVENKDTDHLDSAMAIFGLCGAIFVGVALLLAAFALFGVLGFAVVLGLSGLLMYLESRLHAKKRKKDEQE